MHRQYKQYWCGDIEAKFVLMLQSYRISEDTKETEQTNLHSHAFHPKSYKRTILHN